MKHFLNISGLGEATTEQLRTLDALSEDSPKLTEGAAIALMIDDLIRAGSTVDRPIKILDVTTIMLPGPRNPHRRSMDMCGLFRMASTPIPSPIIPKIALPDISPCWMATVRNETGSVR